MFAQGHPPRTKQDKNPRVLAPDTVFFLLPDIISVQQILDFILIIFQYDCWFISFNWPRAFQKCCDWSVSWLTYINLLPKTPAAIGWSWHVTCEDYCVWFGFMVMTYVSKCASFILTVVFCWSFMKGTVYVNQTTQCHKVRILWRRKNYGTKLTGDICRSDKAKSFIPHTDEVTKWCNLPAKYITLLFASLIACLSCKPISFSEKRSYDIDQV